ncbi:hypothetical protein CEP54_014662 [Fusarium duplospermum]|uniref:Restriction of telomere capping protein 4 n=1 Tax=Fusarium duplospermum TaxID=1325734 RepID=A0A428NUP6_9HYPO|nr:hypothetical protein CEP54_014662 [Fusarium duplospermum]
MVGLNRNQRPQPLLRQIGGKIRSSPEPQSIEDVSAPPLASDSEDDIPEASLLKLVSKSTSRQSPAEDSDLDEPDRGDMKRTRFPKGTNAPRKGNRQASSRQGLKHSVGEDSDEASSSSTKRRKLAISKESAPAKTSPSSSASFLKDECGFTKTRKSKATYSSKGRGSQGSQGSQVSKRSQSTQAKKDSTKASKNVIRDADESGLWSSPEKSSKAKFKELPDDTLGTPKKTSKAKLKTAPGDSFDTPEKEKKIKPIPKEESSPSPTKGGVLRLSQNDDLSQRSSSSQQSKPLWSRKLIEKKARKKAKEAPLKIERATFIVPIEIDDPSGFGSTRTLLDTDSSDTESVKDEPVQEEEGLESGLTKCPWCQELVSEIALKEYSKGKKLLTVHMQKRFCEKHKKETAMETWRERGYPHVDWERLERRFGDHRAYLSRVIDGKRSHFRDILAEKIETGQGRSLKKEGNLNPGYYGPRGGKLMQEYLVEEFSELLMEKAVSDHVIAGRGSAAFIQSVLVAELAVQLIMEDMDVSAAEAREIMEESKAVGEMIHEEV